jgi:protein-L-isoaspartate O-methyltransferase
MNEYLKHYTKNKITPIRQDISDIDKHFNRRESLYHTLGLTPILFKDKKILEVGAGGGYNPIVTNSFAPKIYDIVEPNKYAIDDISHIFEKYNINIDNITLYNQMIEEYKSDMKYDIILCEGLLPGLNNKYKILDILDTFLEKNGILVITCSDEIAFLFEILRYYIANKMIKKDDSFEYKIDIFQKAFGSHLDTLEGMSRLQSDWCADNLMGYAHFNYDLSFSNALNHFDNKYKYYHSSPSLFVDTRWYKQIPQNIQEYNQYFISQYDEYKHNLIDYKSTINKRNKEENKKLVSLAKELFSYIEDEVKNDIKQDNNIIKTIEQIIINLKDITKTTNSLEEIIKIINNKQYDINTISNKYQNFKNAFGRGTMYLSLVKCYD